MPAVFTRAQVGFSWSDKSVELWQPWHWRPLSNTWQEVTVQDRFRSPTLTTYSKSLTQHSAVLIILVSCFAVHEVHPFWSSFLILQESREAYFRFTEEDREAHRG